MDEAVIKKALGGLQWEAEYQKLFKQEEYVSEKFLTNENYLDADFAAFFDDPKLAGCTVLDIGTGTGEQAIYLAKKGFKVTATDVSVSAINYAKIKANQENVTVDFIVDNILFTQINTQFDFVIDRGCYTILPKKYSHDYLSVIKKLLTSDGLFLIKADNVKKHRIDILKETEELEITNSALSSYNTIGGKNIPAAFLVMRLSRR